MVIIVNTGGTKVGRGVDSFDEDNYDADLFSFESDFVEEDLDFEFPDKDSEDWEESLGNHWMEEDYGKEYQTEDEDDNKELNSQPNEKVREELSWVNIDRILVSKKMKALNTVLLSGIVVLGVITYIVNYKKIKLLFKGVEIIPYLFLWGIYLYKNIRVENRRRVC